MAVDVEFADNLAVNKNRNHNLRLGLEGTRQVAGVLIDVVDDHRLSRGCGGSANTLMHWDARMRRHRSLERAEDEHRRLTGQFFDHIETHPVELQQPLVQQLHHLRHQRMGARRVRR